MDPLLERAQAAHEAGDFVTALESWKLLADKDGNPRFLLGYGLAAEELKRWDEAEQAFLRAVRGAPSSWEKNTAVGVLWSKRTDKEKSERLQGAKDWYLEALKLKRHVVPLTLLGAIYVRLKDIASARKAFEDAIEIDPNYEEALYNLAVIEKESDLQRSRGLLERAVQLDPDYLIAHHLLGKVCQQMKDRDRAEYHYRRCLEIDPNDYWSNLFLANLLGVMKRNEEAEQTYRRAIRLCPDRVGGVEFFARFLESIGKNAEAASERAKANLSDRFAAGV